MEPFATIKEFLALTGADAPTSAERALITACRAGKPCILSATRPETPTPENAIRADLLRLLITGGGTDGGLPGFGVWLHGGWITGTLDLDFATARSMTTLDACTFTDAPQMIQAQLRHLSLQGSHLPGLMAETMVVAGSVVLRRLIATGTVDVNGAQIAGQLACEGATLNGQTQLEPWGTALNAQAVTVGADLFLSNVTATGTVDVNGAQITGQLACDGATLNGQTGPQSWGRALSAQAVTVGASLILSKVIATGMVDLGGAQITGQLACEGATLNGQTGPQSWGRALNAQAVTVGASLIVSTVTATGTVDVNGAQITGQLDCTDATLNGQTGPENWGAALNAQGVTVGASLLLRFVTATGTVDVGGARITGQLDCTDATLNGQTGPESWGKALNAQAVTVGADLFLRNVTATGWVDLGGAQITGQMDCKGASFDGKGGWAVNAQRMVVKESFVWREIKQSLGGVHLASAQVGDLADDLESWPADLILDGFTYDRISGAPTDAQRRLGWLAKGSTFKGTFHPQPYTQLAKVLFEMGHDRESRKVLIAREVRLNCEARKAMKVIPNGHVATAFLSLWRDTVIFLHGVWDWLTWLVVRYGYAPGVAFFWALGFIGAFTLLYFLAWQCGVMVPNSDVILTSPDWKTAMGTNWNAPSAEWGRLAPAIHYETFYSLPYAFDIFVPLVDLGQESAWSASTVTTFGKVIRWFTFALQIIGWVITALGAAAITGLIQRDRG